MYNNSNSNPTISEPMTTKGATILEVSGDSLVGSESEQMKGLKRKNEVS